MKRLGVFCGSNRGSSPQYAEAARALGELLAGRNIELVFGGAHVGLMGVVADAVLAGGGSVIGVLPRFMEKKELAHTGLTTLHLVDTMHERKQRMAELADGFVALPGGFGTFEEIFEAITWSQLHLHRSPCGLLNVSGYFDSLVEFLQHSVASGFVRPQQLDSLIVTDTPEALLSRFEGFRPDRSDKWFSTELI
jgi:uncharacterized protein (TIGR00730 family)